MTIARREFLLGMLCLPMARAMADTYPGRPITLLVPFAASGGIADSNARLIAQKLGERLGQSVVVDNRPGAGGNIAAALAARAPNDGYTLMFGTNGTHAANLALYKDLRVHPLKDFTPVHGLFSDFNVLVTGNHVPYRTFAAFIDYARQHPGKVTVGSAGVGTAQHLTAELLQAEAGIKMVHVPYKGSGLAMNDLIGGSVDVMFDYPVSSLPLIAAGKIRPLVVTGKAPLAQLPDVPTIAKAGYPGAESSVWSGVFAPAGTPETIVNRLSAAIDQILDESDIRARAEKNGTVLMRTMDSKRFPTFVASEIVRWQQIVDYAKVTL